MERIVEDVALECIEQAYKYYITSDNTWEDHKWDSEVKYVIANKEKLPPSLKKIFDRLDSNYVSMFFLTKQDYAQILGV